MTAVWAFLLTEECITSPNKAILALCHAEKRIDHFFYLPIVFTEMWERFSFYGIRPLLILFMAATVYDGGMGLARENASAIVGIFAGAMYLAG
jgi:hypothetical protein